MHNRTMLRCDGKMACAPLPPRQAGNEQRGGHRRRGGAGPNTACGSFGEAARSDWLAKAAVQLHRPPRSLVKGRVARKTHELVLLGKVGEDARVSVDAAILLRLARVGSSAPPADITRSLPASLEFEALRDLQHLWWRVQPTRRCEGLHAMPRKLGQRGGGRRALFRRVNEVMVVEQVMLHRLSQMPRRLPTTWVATVCALRRQEHARNDVVSLRVSCGAWISGRVRGSPYRMYLRRPHQICASHTHREGTPVSSGTCGKQNAIGWCRLAARSSRATGAHVPRRLSCVDSVEWSYEEGALEPPDMASMRNEENSAVVTEFRWAGRNKDDTDEFLLPVKSRTVLCARAARARARGHRC